MVRKWRWVDIVCDVERSITGPEDTSLGATVAGQDPTFRLIVGIDRMDGM